MSDPLATRVKAAAGAAWWTVLAGAAFLTFGWLAFVFVLMTEPQWLLFLWGGKEHLTWDEVQHLALTFVGAYKVVLFAVLLIAVWLSLWTRKLMK
jgi:hypothetical protein